MKRQGYGAAEIADAINKASFDIPEGELEEPKFIEPEDNPFMAGAYHGVGEADVVINIGVSGPGVVRAAVSKASKEASIAEIAEIIKKTADFNFERNASIGSAVSSAAGEEPSL